MLFGTLAFLLVSSWIMLGLQSWRHHKQMLRLSEIQSETLFQQGQMSRSSQSEMLETTKELVSKSQDLVAASDPLAYQQIRAMEPDPGYSSGQYDPSDEAETQRIAERNPDLGEPEYSDDEQLAILADITGIDPRILAD